MTIGAAVRTLPRLDGLEVARRLRVAGVRTPILLLTTGDARRERLQGLEAGANDVLHKPFALEELLAGVRAVGLRGSATAGADRLIVADLVLEVHSRRATRAGRSIVLAPKGAALLSYLMRHPGHALRRTRILERVWEYDFASGANVVDAAIRRLRKALDEGHERPLIHTVRGVGYKIKA